MSFQWPSALPQCPLLAGYASGFPNNYVRYETEFGPARQRRRTSANMRQIECVYQLSERTKMPDGSTVDQKAVLAEFLEIAGGRSFWWPNPEKETQQIKVRLKAKDEKALVALTPQGNGLWRVEVSLEVWPLVAREI